MKVKPVRYTIYTDRVEGRNASNLGRGAMPGAGPGAGAGGPTALTRTPAPSATKDDTASAGATAGGAGAGAGSPVTMLPVKSKAAGDAAKHDL